LVLECAHATNRIDAHHRGQAPPRPAQAIARAAAPSRAWITEAVDVGVVAMGDRDDAVRVAGDVAVVGQGELRA